MPFCPFCAQELPDDGAASCVFCGKRLPLAATQSSQDNQAPPDDKKTVMGMHALSPPPGQQPPPGPGSVEGRPTVRGHGPPSGSAAKGSAWPSLPGGQQGGESARSAPPPAQVPQAAAPPPAQVPQTPTPPPPPPRTPELPIPPSPHAGPAPAGAMMDSEPGLDDLAKTILDAEPLAPIPSESVKVEGGPYEIEDPTPKDPPGMEPPMYHPGPQAAPPFPSAMEADPLAPPAAATLPPPSPVGATLEAPPSLAPVGGSEPPPLETREDSALQEALTEAEPSSKQKPTAQEQMGGLPPMPSEGPPGFLAGFGYFFKVTGARWKRGSVITAFKWEIYANEKELKKVQEELGRHAWTSRLDNPLVSEQMGNLNGLETQRAAAQQERQSMAQLIAQEEEGFAQVETRLQGAIQGAQEEVDSFKSELSEKSAELKNLKQRLSQEQKELSRLASQRKTKEGQAGKAKDPEQQANLSQEAAQIGLDIQKAEERETATEAHVAELLGPVDELTAQLTAARANKTGLDKEMSEAKAALSKKTQGFRAEEKKQATEEERLDGEITEALTQMGQTLDEQRPAGAGLDSYYGQLNGIREEIQERERSIQLLEAERENYNRKGYKNGVILMASIGGFLLAVTLTLVLLFTFVFNN